MRFRLERFFFFQPPLGNVALSGKPLRRLAGRAGSVAARTPRVSSTRARAKHPGLLRFVQVVLRNLLVEEHDEQIVRPLRRVVPVEAAVDHKSTINHALLGVDRRIRDRPVEYAVDQRGLNARDLQSLYGRRQGMTEFPLCCLRLADVVLPRQVSVEASVRVHAALMGPD